MNSPLTFERGALGGKREFSPCSDVVCDRPRLSRARDLLEDFSYSDVGLERILGFYEEWVNHNEALLLLKTTLKPNCVEDHEFIAVKCSKRGNDVYVSRVNSRLGVLLDPHNVKNGVFFDIHANVKKTRMVFVVLTFDPKHTSLYDGWFNVGTDFNRWITNLRGKYGRISYFRTYESHLSGFPHINVILYFHDHEFNVFRKNGKWRIEEKPEFEHAYHSNVDVQAVRTLSDAMRYISKDITKTYHENQGCIDDVKKQMLTLALCWVFRKKSFSLGGSLRDRDGHIVERGFFDDLIRSLHSSKFIQTDLSGLVVDWDVRYVLLKNVDGGCVWSMGVLGMCAWQWVKVWDGRPPFFEDVDWDASRGHGFISLRSRYSGVKFEGGVEFIEKGV